MIAERLRTVVAPDGRRVAFALWGDPDGFPVFGNHGCPGCRFSRPPEAVLAELGVLLVTRDRPGYAKSTRRRGRRIVDDVDDAVMVADHLGIERFAVTGVSGGGPHALAAAARLPDRVVAGIASVSMAPLGEGGMAYDAWIEGMDSENLAYTKLEIAGDEAALTEKLEEIRAHIAQNATNPRATVENFDLSEADLEALASAEMAQMLAEASLEWTAAGVEGWVDDSLALARPWGFALAEVSVPVLIRYGVNDVMVPPGHGRWLASQISGCEAWVDEEAGHFTKDPHGEARKGLEWLLKHCAEDR